MTNLIYCGFGIDRINAHNYKTSVNVTTFLKKYILSRKSRELWRTSSRSDKILIHIWQIFMQMYYKVVLQGSIQGDQIVKEPEIQNVSATHKKLENNFLWSQFLVVMSITIDFIMENRHCIFVLNWKTFFAHHKTFHEVWSIFFLCRLPKTWQLP